MYILYDLHEKADKCNCYVPIICLRMVLRTTEDIREYARAME